jgi:hypothetical protein
MSVLSNDALACLFDGNAVRNELFRAGRSVPPGAVSDVLDAVVKLIREAEMVGGTGIEPVTPCLSSTCSTAELTAPNVDEILNQMARDHIAERSKRVARPDKDSK